MRPSFVISITYRHLTVVSFITAVAATLLAVYAVITAPTLISL